MIKGTDVRTIKEQGEVYASIDDLIGKINCHGTAVSTAFINEEFKEVYTLAYCHILELLELFKEY